MAGEAIARAGEAASRLEAKMSELATTGMVTALHERLEIYAKIGERLNEFVMRAEATGSSAPSPGALRAREVDEAAAS